MNVGKCVSVPSRGILFPNTVSNFSTTLFTLFPSPLEVSYFQIRSVGLNMKSKDIVSVPSRGILFPNTGVICGIRTGVFVSVPSRGILFPNYCFKFFNRVIYRFRPLSGYLISKSCPPEPAILLAFLTLLRGKSFSCIFFLYLTYTIASKCSIYAVRGKIIFFLINCCTYLF